MEIHTAYRIVLAHGDDDSRASVAKAVGVLDHALLDSVDNSEDLIAATERYDPDLLICSLELKDGPAVEVLKALATDDPRPSVITTTRDDLESVNEALEDHVMAYLIEPVRPEDLKPTIHLVMARFAEFQALHEEVESLQVALRSRKTVERAKGLLMKQDGLEEAEAFKRLQKLASQKRMKLADVSEAILLAHELKATADSD